MLKAHCCLLFGNGYFSTFLSLADVPLHLHLHHDERVFPHRPIASQKTIIAPSQKTIIAIPHIRSYSHLGRDAAGHSPAEPKRLAFRMSIAFLPED